MPAKKAAKKSTAAPSRSSKAKSTKSKSTKSKSTKSKSTKTTSNQAKKSPAPKARTAAKSKAKSKAGEQEVKIDRRRQADRRDEAGEESTPAQPQLEKRAKVQRRRQIDPTTCERDYSDAEVEFMNAMDEYKRTSGRMFPTCSEVLEVIRELGYLQLTPAEKSMVRPEPVEELATDEPATDQLVTESPALGTNEPSDLDAATLLAEEASF